MSSTALWSIAGIVVSIIVSFLIYRLQKVKKYPSQLSYTILSKSKVLQRVPGAFDVLSLKYNDYSVSQELHYIEVIVFNQRSSDVGNAETDSSISVSLPVSAKWVDVRIKRESKDVGSSISLPSARQADLKFKLLKNMESIIFEGLIESASFFSYRDDKLLTFSHRIPNTDKFHYSSKVSDSRFKESIGFFKHTALVILLLLSLLVSSAVIPFSSGVLYRNSEDGQLYKVSVTHNELFAIESPNGFSFHPKEIIPFSDFLARYVPVSQYHKTAHYGVPAIMLILVIIMFLLITPSEIRSIRRYKQLQKFLKENT